MFLVKTRLDSSPIHGLGAFAAEPIKKGQRIWEFTKGFDIHLSAHDIMELKDFQRNYVLTYAYKNSESGTYVLCADTARFVNHSDTPNCVPFLTHTKDSAYTIAARDIAIGEELTEDYRDFAPEEVSSF